MPSWFAVNFIYLALTAFRMPSPQIRGFFEMSDGTFAVSAVFGHFDTNHSLVEQAKTALKIHKIDTCPFRAIGQEDTRLLRLKGAIR
jgi:hypothetical protein